MKYGELDVHKVIEIFKNHFIVILCSIVICGVSAFLVSYYLITPKYTATASLYVYSNSNRLQEQITSSDLTASQELVNTYIVILESNTVIDKVISELNLAMTPEDIRKILKAGAIDGTEAFQISIKYNDPYTAYMIVNTLVDIAPKEIIRVVQAGGAEVIDYAKVPAKPSSPNIKINTAVGAITGLVLSFGLCIVIFIFDTKIHSEEDLKNIFTIPVLGSVPVLAE